MATLRIALRNAHRIITTSAVASRSTTFFRPQSGWISRYYSTDFSNAQPLNIGLSKEESKRRLFNRLLYRSKQKGFLELDLVLGKWVEQHIHSMDENGIKAIIHVLDLVFSAVQDKVLKNLDNHSSPETRATPGQPWVRGWDDIKKVRDGPITGNQ